MTEPGSLLPHPQDRAAGARAARLRRLVHRPQALPERDPRRAAAVRGGRRRASRSTRWPTGRADELKATRSGTGCPEHPLVASGYPSIGCVPCTSRVAPGEDRAPAAGAASTRPSAASTPPREPTAAASERCLCGRTALRRRTTGRSCRGQESRCRRGRQRAVVSLKRWRDERETLAGRARRSASLIEPGSDWSDIAADLARFPVIAVTIPKYADGRAFSIARLLRERDGYNGEIRAVGAYIIDQVPLMARVGIDAFQTDDPVLIRPLEGRVAGGAALSPAGARPRHRGAGRHPPMGKTAGLRPAGLPALCLLEPTCRSLRAR